MADIIVQPKVLNADGVTYDSLIMQRAQSTTTWPLKYTKINTNTFIAPNDNTILTDVNITINVSDTMSYGNLYKIVYRNYDLNMVFETYISNQGGSFDLITPACDWTYNVGDGKIYNASIYFKGSVTNNILNMKAYLIDGNTIKTGTYVDRINIMAIYKVEGFPSIG